MKSWRIRPGNKNNDHLSPTLGPVHTTLTTQQWYYYIPSQEMMIWLLEPQERKYLNNAAL